MKKLFAALFASTCFTSVATAQNYLRDDGIFHSVVEGTTTGQILVNSGGNLAGVSTLAGTYLTFLQSGTGAQTVTFDSIYRASWVTPEMFSAGGITCTGADDGPAIQRAVTYAGTIRAKVQIKPCAYTVNTPIVDSVGIWLESQNQYTGTIVFVPATDNLIAYRVRNAGSIVSGGGIRNVRFFSGDTTHVKTAIEREDVSGHTIEDIVISGGWNGGFWGDTTKGSIGIRDRGREFGRANRAQVVATRPLLISDNPNSTIDSDHADYNNMYLLADGNPNIQVETGVNWTHLNFSNVSCVRGTYCFYNNDTTTAQISEGLTFHNFGMEQGENATAYNYYIHHNQFVYNVTISGYQLMDGARNGLSLRKIQGLKGTFEYNSTASFQCLDTDATVHGLSWTASTFQGCVTTNFLNQTKVWGEKITGTFVLPRSATYVSTSDDTTMETSSISSAGTIAAAGVIQSGLPGTVTGQFAVMALDGGSGVAISQPGTVAATWLFPTGTGTFAVSASLPLVVNAVTGNITCPTCGTGTGTVTTVSVVTANGISGSVANPTTTPAITLTLGAITPTSVNGNTITTGSGTLTLGAGKTATISNTLTFTGTDGSTLNISTGGTLGSNAFTSTAYAPLASPTFTGVPVAPTAAPGTNTTQLATTAYADAIAALKANIASPTFTGTVTIPNGGVFGTPTSINLTNATALPTTTLTGTLQAAQEPAHTGDVTNTAGSLALTLASVASAGTTGSSTAIPVITINAKGLTTSITTAAVVAPAGTLSGATLAAGVTASSLTSLGTLTSLNVAGTSTLVSSSASALVVGLTSGDPALQIDSSAASSVTGIKITAAVTGGAGAITSRGSAASVDLVLNPKGTATLYLGSSATAFINLGFNGAQTTVAGGLNVTSAAIDFSALASDTATVDNTMCVSGTGRVLKGTGALGICLGTSGRQFKTDFAPMAGAMEEIARLNLWNYRYKKGYGDDGKRLQYGPTAQDVAEVFPDLARYDENGEAISYDAGALLIKGLRSIQQLNERIAKLEARK